MAIELQVWRNEENGDVSVSITDMNEHGGGTGMTIFRTGEGGTKRIAAHPISPYEAFGMMRYLERVES